MDTKNGSGGSERQVYNSTSDCSNFENSMVAPGSRGSTHINRDEFEKDPPRYFRNLHATEKNENKK